MNLDEEFISQSFVRGDRIYLNSASSSLIPINTMKIMTDFTIQYNTLGPDSIDLAKLIAEKSASLRKTVSRLVKCSPDEVVFTQSTTDGINLVANGIRLPKNSNIIIRGKTHEHHANYFPWLRLGAQTELRNLPVDQNGFFAISDLHKLIDSNTGLVVLSHGLYNTGAILPVEEVGQILQEKKIPFFLDAAQTVGCLGEYDFSKTHAGFIAFNGYKWLCGPMGIGILVCKKGSIPLEPTQLAGESAILYDSDKLAYKELPDRLQGGFRNYVAIAGLDASISLLFHLGLDNIRKKIAGLAGILYDELSKFPGISLFGPAESEKRTSIVSFSVNGKDPRYIVEALEKQKIIVAAREISDKKVIRVSPHFFNTESDVLALVEALKKL